MVNITQHRSPKKDRRFDTTERAANRYHKAITNRVASIFETRYDWNYR